MPTEPAREVELLGDAERGGEEEGRGVGGSEAVADVR